MVPEFPQSRNDSGSLKDPHLKINELFLSFISMPHYLIQFLVERTSAPVERLEIIDSFLPRVASIRARWEIDLSPGRDNSPLTAMFIIS